MARKKLSVAQKVRNYKDAHPEATGVEIAKALKVKPGSVYAATSTPKKKAKRVRKAGFKQGEGAYRLLRELCALKEKYGEKEVNEAWSLLEDIGS